MKSLLLLLMLAVPAQAALELVLAPSRQSSARGGAPLFRVTLTNTSATQRVWLNDIAFSYSGGSGAHLTPDANVFFANVPGILEPGEVYAAGEMFGMRVGNAAPYGELAASVEIRGGASQTATDALATASFTIAVPDPALDETDADHDGQLLSLEHALNLDPQLVDAFNVLHPQWSTDAVSTIFTPNPAAIDVSITVEGSTDLQTWSTSFVEDTTPLEDLPLGRRTYRYHPLPPGGRGFLRLRVTRP